MPYTDGLIWIDDAEAENFKDWKYINSGPGYVNKSIKQNDKAKVRVVSLDPVKEGWAPSGTGPKIDLSIPDTLLTSCKPQTLSENTPLEIMWAGVHPCALNTAIIVWNSPVRVINKNGISMAGGNVKKPPVAKKDEVAEIDPDTGEPAVDENGDPKLSPHTSVTTVGRIMYVGINAVAIDGSSTANITINKGAVGSYGFINDPKQIEVPTLDQKALYATTLNDTNDTNGDSVSASPVNNKKAEEVPIEVGSEEGNATVIPAFYFNQEQLKLEVKCVYTFEMQEMVSPGSGENLLAWALCYLLWGSTEPMDLYPFNAFPNISSLPVNGYQAIMMGPAFASTDQAIDAKADGAVTNEMAWVIGNYGRPYPVSLSLAGPVGVALRPGQLVSFKDFTDVDEAEVEPLANYTETGKEMQRKSIPVLAQIDDPMIKPIERIFASPPAYAQPAKWTPISLCSPDGTINLFNVLTKVDNVSDLGSSNYDILVVGYRRADISSDVPEEVATMLRAGKVFPVLRPADRLKYSKGTPGSPDDVNNTFTVSTADYEDDYHTSLLSPIMVVEQAAPPVPGSQNPRDATICPCIADDTIASNDDTSGDKEISQDPKYNLANSSFPRNFCENDGVSPCIVQVKRSQYINTWDIAPSSTP